jgi:hypothetical protein
LVTTVYQSAQDFLTKMDPVSLRARVRTPLFGSDKTAVSVLAV